MIRPGVLRARVLAVASGAWQRTRRSASAAAAALGVRARLLAAVVVTAVLVGTGVGATLALWQDRETFTARMPVGVAVFGAGAPGEPVYATTTAPGSGGTNVGTVGYGFGPAQAAELYNGNAGNTVAIPLQVHSLAQGHRGLHYALGLDVVEGGVFDAAELTTYRVPDEAACTPAVTDVETTSFTPWTADYASDTQVSSDYWCLVARYVPTQWEHTNTATATATDPAGGGTLVAEGSWSAASAITFDPGAEPTHAVSFGFTTFRPGWTP